VTSLGPNLPRATLSLWPLVDEIRSEQGPGQECSVSSEVARPAPRQVRRCCRAALVDVTTFPSDSRRCGSYGIAKTCRRTGLMGGLLGWLGVHDHGAPPFVLPARADRDITGVSGVADHRYALRVPHVNAQHLGGRHRLRQGLRDLRCVWLQVRREVNDDRVHVAAHNGVSMLLDVVTRLLIVHESLLR
jgi:hypothetical protein